MKTWQYYWCLVSFQPGVYLLSILQYILIVGLPLLAGLIIRKIFDTLSRQSQLSWDLWSLMALLMASTLAEIVLLFGGEAINILLRANVNALLRKNLLLQILKRPGAQALSTSTGEAINRFGCVNDILKGSLR